MLIIVPSMNIAFVIKSTLHRFDGSVAPPEFFLISNPDLTEAIRLLEHSWGGHDPYRALEVMGKVLNSDLAFTR
jgi:hypothetical protein